MSEQNKKFPTFQLNVDDFLPADEAEKESLYRPELLSLQL